MRAVQNRVLVRLRMAVYPPGCFVALSRIPYIVFAGLAADFKRFLG
jgi:hypothetical protein